MTMKSKASKIALVTGASSGIGQATALYPATEHAVAGYTESLDHELRTQGIRVSVVEPAYINTPFDANLMKPDAPSTCIARFARAWRGG